MDPVLTPLAMAAGAALVGAIAEDQWRQAKGVIVKLWKRARPHQADVASSELDALRRSVVRARRSGDRDFEESLKRDWQVRLQGLLEQDPNLVTELERILEAVLAPILPTVELARIRAIAEGVHDRRVPQAQGVEHLPGTPYAVRMSLPADVSTFTGRASEIDTVVSLVNEALEQKIPKAQSIVQAIDGMPGAGKTAFAVHLAHRLKDRFPDRQLFLDLRGHTPGLLPMTSFHALGALLVAMGMDARFLPPTLEGRVGLWRDQVAGNRILLLLDNAADSLQVNPLLPGSAGCLVLITSRRYLGDIEAGSQSVPLGPLPETEARELFLRLAFRAGDSTANIDMEAVQTVIDLTGRLPLAIALLARLYGNHPSWTLPLLIDKTHDRLLTVRAESKTLIAAFDLSHAALSGPQQRFFALLGLHPGAEIDDYAAAALAGISLPEAAELLEHLYALRFLTEISLEPPGRYGMHDLIRAYSRQHATELPVIDQEQAMNRLLDYYQKTAAHVDGLLGWHTRPLPINASATASRVRRSVAVPDLRDQARALAWVRAERANILACLAHASSTGLHARIVALTASVAEVLRRDGPWTEARILHTAAAQVARQVQDNLGYAAALQDLAVLQRLMGEYAQAIEVSKRALKIYQELGHRLGQANALDDIGVTRYLIGEYSQAKVPLEEALGVFCELKDRRGQASALYNLGAVQRLTGDLSGSAELRRRALALYEEMGDQLGEADALHGLGVVRYLSGDLSDASALMGRSLVLYEELGDRLGQANAVNGLGVVARLSGNVRLGAELLEHALAMYRELGVRGGEAEVLNQLGELHRVAGALVEAEASHRLSLQIAQEIESLHDQAQALAGLAHCDLARGRSNRARIGFTAALTILQRTGTLDTEELEAELAILDQSGSLPRD